MKKKLRFSAELLKSIRESKGMSQTKLAEFSGLNRSEIWKLETGKNKPRTETLLKIADGLNIKIQALFEDI
jgi:transcriptional regulator with XRE-family HTH domain